MASSFYHLSANTGSTASDIVDILKIFSQTWTLSKTFAEGDFSIGLSEKTDAILGDEEFGVEVVDEIE